MGAEKLKIEGEYKGDRPGCYQCKKPIEASEDFYRLTWVGKTWEMTVNYHMRCMKEACENNEFQSPHLEVKPRKE